MPAAMRTWHTRGVAARCATTRRELVPCCDGSSCAPLPPPPPLAPRGMRAELVLSNLQAVARRDLRRPMDRNVALKPPRASSGRMTHARARPRVRVVRLDRRVAPRSFSDHDGTDCPRRRTLAPRRPRWRSDVLRQVGHSQFRLAAAIRPPAPRATAPHVHKAPPAAMPSGRREIDRRLGRRARRRRLRAGVSSRLHVEPYSTTMRVDARRAWAPRRARRHDATIAGSRVEQPPRRRRRGHSMAPRLRPPPLPPPLQPRAPRRRRLARQQGRRRRMTAVLPAIGSTMRPTSARRTQALAAASTERSTQRRRGGAGTGREPCRLGQAQRRTRGTPPGSALALRRADT